MIILVFTIFFYFLFVVIFVSLFYSAVRYVPFVPTEYSVMKLMINEAKLKDGQVVYDLGCGDGRLLIEAMKNRNIIANGVEVNWFIYWLAKFRFWMMGKKVQLTRGNFFKVPLGEGDVIFCYLFPKVMQKLKIKFSQELKKGAIVISYCFPIKDWKPTKIIPTKKGKPNNFLIYIYQIPCPVAP